MRHTESLVKHLFVLTVSLGTGKKVTIRAFPNSNSIVAGADSYSLMCSATIVDSPLSLISPAPSFEWFFGLNSNTPLPSGLVPRPISFHNGTYTSTLQFSPPSQSHTGMYTCRLGAGSLMNSTIITVNGIITLATRCIFCIINVYYVIVSSAPFIGITVTANPNSPLMVGQNYTLTCEVSGAERLSPMIAYQWTRNNQGVSDNNLKTLNLSPLRFSHAGSYACNVTVSSALLSSNISASSYENRNVTIQSE